MELLINAREALEPRAALVVDGRLAELMREPATEAAAHAKKFATRELLNGVVQCMQALGANGLRHDLPLARHLAAAKITQYIDGTTEIQNVVLSRSLFGTR